MTIFLLLALFGNLWIYKIFQYSTLLGLLTIATSYILYEASNKQTKTNLAKLSILLMITMLVQYKISDINALTYLNIHETDKQQYRVRAYPPPKILPLANWLELRPETLAFYKIEQNISEIVDPNLYFFANHPRERIGVQEKELFPYIFLPAFILGLLKINKKNTIPYAIAASPIVLISTIGNSNPLGPFTLFPLFAVSIAQGLKSLNHTSKFTKLLLAILFILVFIQSYAYSVY